MQEILLKIRYFERGLSKSLKKVTCFFFRTQSFLMEKIVKKQKGHETSDQWLFRFKAYSRPLLRSTIECWPLLQKVLQKFYFDAKHLEKGLKS